MTLIVKGTWASELRTRFCPMRFTYSVMTGSRTSLEVASTSWAYCLPMRISLSSEYQSPNPRPPTLRLPMAFTSLLPPSCLTLLSSGCWITGGRISLSLSLSFALASAGGLSLSSLTVESVGAFALGSGGCWENVEGASNNVDTATVPTNRRNFITNSCPGPGPDMGKLYARLETELLAILMTWTRKMEYGLSRKNPG